MPQQVPITTMSENRHSTLNDADDDDDDKHRRRNIYADADASKQQVIKIESTINNEKSSTINGDAKLDAYNTQNTANSGATMSNNEFPPVLGPQKSTLNNNNHNQTNTHSNTTANVALGLNSTSSANNVANATTKAPTKLNGLKNRIIQRPPPLVLDKVSNFYDIETNNCNLNQSSQASVAPAVAASRDSNATGSNAAPRNKRRAPLPPVKIQSDDGQSVEQRGNASANTISGSNGGGSSSANQKFWASLNENASRNKALASARAAVNGSATYSQHYQDTSEKTANAYNNSSKDATDSADTLGADLVIRHRNTSSGKLPTRSGRKIEPTSKNSPASKKSFDSDSRNHHSSQKITTDSLNSSGEQDDGTTQSEHNGSVGGGGNLIGVDNSTPPGSSGLLAHHSIDDAPLSATSSRPRSNNPFLDNDDEDDGFESDSRVVTRKQQVNNFHKRPASFIAATTTDKVRKGTGPFADDPAEAEQQQQKQQQQLANQFSELNMTNKQIHGGLAPSQAAITNNATDYETAYTNYSSIYVNQQPANAPDASASYQPNNMFKHASQRHTTNNDVTDMAPRANLNRDKMLEHGISLDSESTNAQPPPSATMQLPHWTDAIYELKNAILDTNSVTGGAENGQFIFIAESGDIILELDSVKVSGYTLIEFNELIESKQFHLLNAVQTKHSYGLTHDLKHYLNQSFPKNSSDKNLQNLIRENIYRRTIPCTTRPPRPGERDKVDYHFLTREQFVELNNRAMLLECGVYAGYYYGTLKPLCDLNTLSTIYQSFNSQPASSGEMRQSWDANHPAVESTNRGNLTAQNQIVAEYHHHQQQQHQHPLYENHESMQIHTRNHATERSPAQAAEVHNMTNHPKQQIILPQATSAIQQQNGSGGQLVADTEPLPPGWEQINDQTHGTYYIDHNAKRTQYERPYEVELTKGSMGFGFTLVEADSGILLVRSIIQGGPAHLNGSIRPGDILISAVGISVAGLQHTDVARLFSTFAVGDQVRLTFARSNFVPDNIVPDEYLFSNGTNGDLAIAVNPNTYLGAQMNVQTAMQSPHIIVNQEFEFIHVSIRRGSQGFGFTISDSMAGQKVRKIQNSETCANLKQGDILISINGEDICGLTHKEVVELLKNCPPGEDVRLTVKRKKRFRSKTPMAMHTDAIANGEYSLDSTPQRNCKTPSLDGLMLMRPTAAANQDSTDFAHVSRPLFQNQQQQQQLPPPPLLELQHHKPAPLPPSLPPPPLLPPTHESISSLPRAGPVSGSLPAPVDYAMTGLPIPGVTLPHPRAENQIYGALPGAAPYFTAPDNEQASYNGHLQQQQSINQSIYGSTNPNHLSYSMTNTHQSIAKPPGSIQSASAVAAADQLGSGQDDLSNCAQASESCMPMNDNNSNQPYNSYVPQMHQMPPISYQMLPAAEPVQVATDYYQLPLYSNSEMINGEYIPTPALPAKPTISHSVIPSSYMMQNGHQDNYYANNEEIAIQNVQYPSMQQHRLQQQIYPLPNDPSMMQPELYEGVAQDYHNNEHDDYEYHHVDLERENSESNWGIRLIGGAEVDRAISIGSIVFGGAASKNGQLKSGDEIISINGISIVGATHQRVVELISACTNRASLVVRRKQFAEACDVVLTRNMDEGFGFVIISSGNCALIGRIIEGSPADRCKQLHVRDRIIAVNGRYITANMRHPQIVSMIKECGSTLRLRIIPVDCYTVELIKNAQNDNFGFGIRGGSEYDGTPLYILRVAPNGLARDLLNVGDQILEINNIPTVGMTHQQAATIIKYSDPIVKLKLRRNYVTPASLLFDSPRELQKFNQVKAEMIAVNQNSTPNHHQSLATVASEGGPNQPCSLNSLGLAATTATTVSSEIGSAHSLPVVGQSSGGVQVWAAPQQLQQSSSLTLDHQQADQSQEAQMASSSSTVAAAAAAAVLHQQHGNQSQPLYA